MASAPPWRRRCATIAPPPELGFSLYTRRRRGAAHEPRLPPSGAPDGGGRRPCGARLLSGIPAALPRRPQRDAGALLDHALDVDRVRRRGQGPDLRPLRAAPEVVALLRALRPLADPARRRRRQCCAADRLHRRAAIRRLATALGRG